MPQLICRNLTLGYEGKAMITHLSFTVNHGDYLCIVGENGSGKTTLMKTILKLNTSISGYIEMGDGLAANQIGYMPQQTIVQKDFPASVTEVIRSGFLNRRGFRPFYSGHEKKIVELIMGKLGISSLAKLCYRELSGGQQQRVLLARALCATEKIILLDEPAAGLDPKAALEMYELIYQLNKDGITIMMVSHDINAAIKYATHILQIGAGCICDSEHSNSFDDPCGSQSIFFFGTRDDYLKSETGRMYTGLRLEGGSS